ncbi:MAG: SGNH/GDSL hydrolase family protein [Myxococcota bacterium]
MFLITLSAVLLLALGCGCGEDDESNNNVDPNNVDGLKALAIGDSALEWNGIGASTPSQLEAAIRSAGTDMTVINTSISGTCLTACPEVGTLIPDQYTSSDYAFVLISGGANDIFEGSNGCGSADPYMSADLTGGLMVDLINRVTADGNTVVLYGYFEPLDEGGSVAACGALWTLLERYQDFAANRDDVVFINAMDVIDRSKPQYYADDVHPSPEGSAALGNHIALQLGYLPD